MRNSSKYCWISAAVSGEIRLHPTEQWLQQLLLCKLMLERVSIGEESRPSLTEALRLVFWKNIVCPGVRVLKSVFCISQKADLIVSILLGYKQLSSTRENYQTNSISPTTARHFTDVGKHVWQPTLFWSCDQNWNTWWLYLWEDHLGIDIDPTASACSLPSPFCILP